MENDRQPYYLAHPEMNLKPISEFEKLHFIFNKPEYLEMPSGAKPFSCYLWIVKDGKIGIMFWEVAKQLVGYSNKYHIVIPCRYDKIEKNIPQGNFKCFRNNSVVYYDLKGNILK